MGACVHPSVRACMLVCTYVLFICVHALLCVCMYVSVCDCMCVHARPSVDAFVCVMCAYVSLEQCATVEPTAQFVCMCLVCVCIICIHVCMFVCACVRA